SDAPSLHASTVHQQRIELYATICGEETTSASVEGRIIFKHGDGGFNGINSSATAGKNLVTHLQSMPHSCLVLCRRHGWDRPGSAVDKERGIVSGWLCGHFNMVVHREGRSR